MANINFTDISTAPKDGTMLRLLVDFDPDDDYNGYVRGYEDKEGPDWVSGCSFRDNHDDGPEWVIIGWNWGHDCFVELDETRNVKVLEWRYFNPKQEENIIEKYKNVLNWIDKIATVNYEQDTTLRTHGARTLKRIFTKIEKLFDD